MSGISGLSVVSGVASNFMNRSQNEEQRQFSRQMLQNQQNFNSHEAQMARQYNSIGAQKQRMLAAGYNPDLMYGMSTGLQTGQVADSSLGQTPSVTPYQSPFGADVANAFTNERLADVQESLLESQADLNKAKAEESRSQSELNEEYIANQEHVRIKIDKDVELEDEQIESLKVQSKKIEKEVDYINQQIEDLKEVTKIHGEEALQSAIQSKYFETQIQEVIKNIKAQINNLDSSSKYYQSLKNLTDRELREAIETFALRLAGLQKQNGDNGVLDRVLENMRLTNEGLSVDVEIKKSTKDFEINTHSGPLGYTSFVVQNIVGPLLDGITDFFWAKGFMKSFGKRSGKAVSGAGSQVAGKSVGKGAGSAPSPASAPSSAPQNLPSFNWFGPNGEPKHVNTNNPAHLSPKQRQYLDKYYPRGWFIDSKGDIHSK